MSKSAFDIYMDIESNIQSHDLEHVRAILKCFKAFATKKYPALIKSLNDQIFNDAIISPSPQNLKHFFS